MSDKEEGVIATTFRLRIPEPRYRQLLMTTESYPEECQVEMLELLQHALVQGKFELVLSHLEKYRQEFILRHDIPVQMSEAEKQLKLDPMRILFYRIRAFTLKLCAPVG